MGVFGQIWHSTPVATNFTAFAPSDEYRNVGRVKLLSWRISFESAGIFNR
jgi:hypothetical protein